MFLSILHCFENLSVLWCPRLLRLTSEFNTSFDRISIRIQYWNCLFTISGFPSVPPADSAWINYPGWAQVLWVDINWTSNGLQSYQIQLWSLLTILWIIECILSAGSQQSKDIKWAFYCLMLLPQTCALWENNGLLEHIDQFQSSPQLIIGKCCQKSVSEKHLFSKKPSAGRKWIIH